MEIIPERRNVVKKFQNPRVMVTMVLMLLLCVGFFYYISNRENAESEREETKTSSAVSTVLLRDLEHNYPATPKEVMKYYADLNQVLYSENYTDIEFYSLVTKMELLFDEELIENQEQNAFQDKLKEEIATFHKNKWVISSYTTSVSTDVERFWEDGFEFARLYCTFHIRQGGGYGDIDEVFLLRRDEKDHWRIYGWRSTKEN